MRHIHTIGVVLVVLPTLVSTAHSQERSRFSDRIGTVVRSVYPEWQGREEELPRKCGTPFFVEVLQQWEKLSILTKQEIIAGFQRPQKQKSRLSASGRFRIHYDTTGFATPALLNTSKQPIPNSYEAYVDSAAKYFDHSWTKIVDSLGYAAPPGDGVDGGGPEYDVYLDDLGFGVSGFTSWDPNKPLNSEASKRYATYAVIDNDFLHVRTQGVDGLKITAAHEFFHAIQVGAYGVWTTIRNADFYFYELTAVWMEDVLFTTVNDYFFDLPTYFRDFVDSQGRSFSFTTFSSFYPGYERSVWAHFLAKRFGRNIIRQTWEAMKAEPFLRGIDHVLGKFGTNLAEEYATFSQWNYFTADRADTVRYYSEGKYYPLLKPNIVQSYDGVSSLSVQFTAYPLSAQMFVFGGLRDSVYSLITNVDVPLAMTYRDTTVSFEVRLTSSTPSIPYQTLGNGLKVGFSATDLAKWRIEHLLSTNRADVRIVEQPFPNPVRMSEVARITLPVTTVAQDADVYFFSTSLDLLYSGRYQVTESLGKRYVYVPTRDIGSKVASGVYFVVVQCPDAEYRWKVALIH